MSATPQQCRLRNVLAHSYDILEYEILWDVVQNNIPVLTRDIDNRR